MSLRSLTDKLDVQAPVDKVFQYFTDTDRLVNSFPPDIGLRLIRRTSRFLTQGSAMEFSGKLAFFPAHWKSRIHSYSPRRHISFIWHRNPNHTLEQDYYFESLSINRTRIIECLLYRTSMGFLGDAWNRLYVVPQLKKIMEYKKGVFLDALQSGKLDQPVIVSRLKIEIDRPAEKTSSNGADSHSSARFLPDSLQK